MSECHSVGSHLDTVCPSNIKLVPGTSILTLSLFWVCLRDVTLIFGVILQTHSKESGYVFSLYPKAGLCTCSTCNNDSPTQLKLIYQYIKTLKPRKFSEYD